ncbi:hypothetical protein MLD38_018303 [Melastoma candidum]|uniref:Uncharacterized protein n=1 Tax=Melastoma candidum TaxID=119954 RepID=A0ACB9QTG7_9MYRT|nr:hypothetical protein MLD38_018303 [Melastoma candidum]
MAAEQARTSVAVLDEQAKLDFFLAWLKVNGAQLRGCSIRYSDSTKGYGVFSSGDDCPDGVLMLVPLDLAITPMRVLQDPLLGPECRAMFEEGEVDDRLLMILFLTVERLRRNSSWKPYFNMLPGTFTSPIWFSDAEFTDLKGTSLYRATQLQRKQLLSLFKDKVKALVEKLLDVEDNSESSVSFEDFLWANSIFWTRALNIPLPRSYVFPECDEADQGANSQASDRQFVEGTSTCVDQETVWVEGLIPGIDFCNHDLKAGATWEVDKTGEMTCVPLSMYLLSAGQGPFDSGKEIRISYGNKGNEELLYLYGFVIDNNPDDYLMVHYPAEAIQSIPFSEAKVQLLDAQEAELRCLLPRNLLDRGFFGTKRAEDKADNKNGGDRTCSYSWSGQRRAPSYLKELVFPDSLLITLRTIAMKEHELLTVSNLLEELVGSEQNRQPSGSEVQAAVWEACGDSGAFQLLVDLLQTKMMDLEEGTGTEDQDAELLCKVRPCDFPIEHTEPEKNFSEVNGSTPRSYISRNRWSAIVYRKGQKELTRLFLKEAEHALQLALSEGN